MGLSNESCSLAWRILNEINPLANNSFITVHESHQIGPENTIMGWDKKYDGSWENIFTDIKNMTNDQMKIWEQKKRTIGNTPFVQTKENGYTRIGWI